MQIYTISQARENLFKIANETINNSQPVMITHKKDHLILISMSDYTAMEETCYIKSIRGLEESLIEGMKEPLSSCATEINWDEE